MKFDALLWDYDGTIVNSVPKNIAITKEIIAEVAPRLTGENLPKYLRSEAEYHVANHQSENWQDLYVNYYGMTEAEMLEAGPLWTPYQLADDTPVELFEGMAEVIRQIDLPQGICSQNSAENIRQLLTAHRLSEHFGAIVGYDDIPSDAQKPHPYSGVECLKRLLSDIQLQPKTLLYVGDHEGDVLFARNIQRELGCDTRVVAAVVTYSGAEPLEWEHRPDWVVVTPGELLSIIGSIIKQ